MSVRHRSQTDIAFRLHVQSSWRRVKVLVSVRKQDGSGLTMSRALRTFFYEYAHRTVHHGPYSLPSSFNVVEAFLSYHNELCIFDTIPEVEHLLTIDDYFKWYEGEKWRFEPKVLVDVLRENIIYSYNFAYTPSGFKLSTDTSELMIAGISFVRHGHELSCFLIAGENPPNPPDDKVCPTQIADSFVFPGKENIEPAVELGVKDRYLDEFPGFARVIMLTRLDLRANTHDVRYILCDFGNGYHPYSDDFYIYDGMPADQIELLKIDAIKGLKRYETLFSALASLVYLPVAFSVEQAYTSNMVFATELSTNENCIRDAVKELGDSQCVRSRIVRCLARSSDSPSDASILIQPPELEFQTDGFWKPLPPGQVGLDKNGIPIIGKTWVSRTESWSSRSPEKFLLDRPPQPPDGPDPGTIYVVRCPEHGINVYKIGLTRRSAEIRAKELSSTPTPTPFGVMGSWEVGDCAKVEKEIHLKLGAYRIDTRREFFRLNISSITKAIESVIRAST